MDWFDLAVQDTYTHIKEKREDGKFLREEIVLLSQRYVLAFF